MKSNNPLKILFVCSMNQWRSPTAEKVYSNHSDIDARSCGTSRKAVSSVSAEKLMWADVIMVMEQKHRSRLLAEFPGQVQHKDIHVLDIPDEYKFMEPELIVEIESAVDPLLQARQDSDQNP